MAQLLKRTKKSCIKFFRKLTSSAKLSATKLEEEPAGSRPMQKCIDQKEEHTETEIAMSCPYTISSKIENNRNKSSISTQNCNYSSSRADNKKSTNFIVSSHYASKLDTYLTNARQTISPNFLTCDIRSFQILSEEDASNVQNDFSTRQCSAEIIFEKVKYRDNIRYFRRTPSNSTNSSISSHPSTPKVVQHNKEYNCVLNEKKTEYNCNSSYTQSRQSNIYLQFRNSISHPVNLTLTSNPVGNLNNLVISERRNWLNEACPIVTWDINGNSIDDEITCLNSNWDDCDNRLNMLLDKRITKTRSDDSYKSSSQSSSTTLDTWVDDEILENSFNEEIEKHLRM